MTDNPNTVRARRGLNKKHKRALYRYPHSFVDFLPWVEYLADDGVFLLEDNASVGAVFELQPRGTAGRTQDFLTTVRDTIEDALQDAFEEYDSSPWVLQTYTFDTLDLDHLIDEMRRYVRPHARHTAYTEEYLALLARHYRGIARPGGLFMDDDVTKTTWGGRIRKNYVVIYRRLHGDARDKRAQEDPRSPVQALNDACEKFINALAPVGLHPQRVSGTVFHRWLQAWFNPSTELFGGDITQFLHSVQLDDESLPAGDEFAQTLLYNYPRSDHDNQCWFFGDTAMRCLTVDGIRRRPQVGHATGEIQRADATNAMMDLMPEGTIMVSTVVVVPQDTVEAHIEAISKAAIGDAASAARTRSDCLEAKKILGERHKFYRARYAFYVKADSIAELNRLTNQARSILLNHHFRAIAVKDDIKALDNFILNLPMVYDPDQDRREGWRQAQLTVTQHIANLSCCFGRSRGTGHPGVVDFNRGGEPLSYDPLNPADRRKNGHLLLLGPTGAGKSAKLVSMLSHVMAVSRPRLFIVEAGNSFGLLADWFAQHGLSVNKVALKPGNGVVLPPFAEAHKALAQTEYPLPAREEATEADESEDEQRDILGEMEIIAQLMITGGEEREAALLRRSDKRLIRDAILWGAEQAAGEQRMTLTRDVRDGFIQLAGNSALDDRSRSRLQDMANAMGLFCDGFNGDVFNAPGDTWPEADVTVIDLATFAREGYEAHLAIAVISCLNRINNIAERDQHGAREIVVAIDEAHIITTNPLLAPYLVKVVKMWRKLGAWLWSATQNLEDYPGAAKRVLNLVEWWVCLVMPKEEVEEIARFRHIDEAQRQLLLSASKSPGKYTEGVLLSENLETLFRCVPPSLMLALAMTEKHEKAQRAELMRRTGCSEVEAAKQIARQIDQARGIAP